MKKRVTVTAMMMAVMLSWPMEALCQTKVTAGKDVKTIGVTAAAEGSQEVVTQIDEEGREVLAVEGSTVRVIGNDPEAGKVARLKISKIPGSEVVLTQEITVRGQNIISGGQTIQLAISVQPAYAHPQATWSIEDCDIDGNPQGTQKNASLSEDHKLTGLKTGYVKVTASATDGSGVTDSQIFRVTTDAPTAETSAIGGGSASFSPAVPMVPSLVEANPNSDDMIFLREMIGGFNLENIKSQVPGEARAKLDALINYNTIIGNKALRLVNYQPYMGDFSCYVKINSNQGVPGDPVVFLMLYMDINMQLTGDVVNATLLVNNTIKVTLPANIATAIRDKDFWGIVVEQ